MKLVIKPRQIGKTYELIRMAYRDNGLIVSPTCTCAKHVEQMAQSMGCDIDYPMTLRELVSKKHCIRPDQRLYLDDADIMLHHLSPFPIEAVSMTGNCAPPKYSRVYDGEFVPRVEDKVIE